MGRIIRRKETITKEGNAKYNKMVRPGISLDSFSEYRTRSGCIDRWYKNRSGKHAVLERCLLAVIPPVRNTIVQICVSVEHICKGSSSFKLIQAFSPFMTTHRLFAEFPLLALYCRRTRQFDGSGWAFTRCGNWCGGSRDPTLLNPTDRSAVD